MGRMQLGVIYGSRSCEHDVSIISAVQLMGACDPEKYEVIPVYISRQGIWYTGEKLKSMAAYTPFREDAQGIEQVTLDLTPGSGALIATRQGKGLFSGLKQEVVARLECVCIVMHGMHGEDGTLQGLMEMANLPYTSTGVAGSAVGMDKIMMKQFFRGAGLPVLDSLWFTRRQWAEGSDAIRKSIEETLRYPVYVKPANLGSSIGVSRAEDPESLKEAMELAFSYDRRVLVEKGLDHPIELNCSVVGYDGTCEASVIEMPVASGDMLDFWEKYLRGGNGGSKGMASLSRVVPAPVEDAMRDQIQQMSKDIFVQMDCKGVVRIDYMYDQKSEQFYITEINTIPGSLAFYLWEKSGLSYPKLIDRMVKDAISAHQEKNAHSFAFESDILKGVNLGGKAGKLGGKAAGKNGL